MTIQELRQLTFKQLKKELEKARRALAVKRFHCRTGQDQKTSDIKLLKKTIARILTLIRQNHSDKKK